MDLLIENARVLTLDDRDTVAEAIAVRDGRVLAVGSRREVAAVTGPGTHRIDAGGGTVLPAFIDAHMHYHKAALARAYAVDFLEVAPVAIADVQAAVRVAVAARPAGSWLRGDSLDPRKLGERRYPTRWELDAVAPEHAVVLYGVGNHVAAANSLALNRAGIDRDTQDPPGGRLERTEDGEPTGVLFELAKLALDPNLPTSVVPVPSDDDRLRAIEAAQAHLHRAGISAIHDMVMDPRELGGWMRLHQEGRLTLRVRVFVRGYEARTSLEDVLRLGLRMPFGDEWLQLTGIKLSVDGAAGEHNAATHAPYPGMGDHRGLVRIPQDVLDGLVDRAHAAGLRVAIHAIGDRAVDMALDAYERAFERHGRGSLRHRIEHAFLPPPDGQVARIAAAGLIVSTQPGFLWDGDGWAETWGVEHLTSALPIRSWLDAGITVTGSTDWPCIPVNPWPGIVAAVTRTTRDGDVIAPDQAVSLREAVRMQTAAAAWAGGDEALLGSIEPGRAGDLAVYPDDPFEIALEDARAVVPTMTIVGGRVMVAGESAGAVSPP